MTATEKGAAQMVGKSHPLLEAVYGSLSGMAFGLLSPLASQPFDTIKVCFSCVVFRAQRPAALNLTGT